MPLRHKNQNHSYVFYFLNLLLVVWSIEEIESQFAVQSISQKGKNIVVKKYMKKENVAPKNAIIYSRRPASAKLFVVNTQ
jgi:hypothetical protein